MFTWLLKYLIRLAMWLGLGLILLSVMLVLPWRWLNPPTTAFIIAHDLGGRSRLPLQWVELNDLGSALQLAVVSAEDQKFPHHWGFDLTSIKAALNAHRQGSGRLRGASTISQQLAKNMYLWPGRHWLRKGLEAYLTLWIEALWPKQRILEIYLNRVEFGRGVYGAGTAASHFFRKRPAQLSRREASLLAAVLPNPKARSARRPSAGVLKQAKRIRRGIAALGGKKWLPWLR